MSSNKGHALEYIVYFQFSYFLNMCVCVKESAGEQTVGGTFIYMILECWD